VGTPREILLPASKRPLNPPFPEAGAMMALRARLQGVAASKAVKRYVPERMRRGGSARQVLQEIRLELVRRKQSSTGPTLPGSSRRTSPSSSITSIEHV